MYFIHQRFCNLDIDYTGHALSTFLPTKGQSSFLLKQFQEKLNSTGILALAFHSDSIEKWLLQIAIVILNLHKAQWNSVYGGEGGMLFPMQSLWKYVQELLI